VAQIFYKRIVLGTFNILIHLTFMNPCIVIHLQKQLNRMQHSRLIFYLKLLLFPECESRSRRLSKQASYKAHRKSQF